jgi:peptidoglycan/xylan/chitin deacetylase (PgdA/CDA1 family)
MKGDIKFLKFLFPSVLVKTADAGIHLTFDDGPHSIATPSILNILKARNIHASFFLLGQNIKHYPDITQQISSEGHQIGNHSYTHTNLFFKNRMFIQKEILQTEEVIEATLGKRTCFFRPPYGSINMTLLNVLKEYGLTCVLWTADSKDFLPQKSSDMERRIFQNTSSGSILLFHDNEYTAPSHRSYLPKLLDTLLEKGFVFTQLPL